MFSATTRIVAAAAVFLVLAAAGFGLPGAVAQEISREQLDRVAAALPEAPTVQPAQPRKLLIFTLCQGFYHDAIPIGTKAFEMMGEKTGAYEVVVSDDVEMFAPDALAQFDAVCFMNTTGTLFDRADLRDSLMAFVKGGKGVVGVHAATDCFYDWAEFGEMMGGYFDGHPWGAGDTVHVKLDDPAHPLNRAFNGMGFAVRDEIYQFREPYSREKLRVLASLDTAKTDMTKDGIKRTDGDFAISWCRAFGEGRVFYCSLGHNWEIFWNPQVLQHYLDGIQFAMGDLPVDVTPSAQLSPEAVAQSQAEAAARALEGWLAALAAYDYGDDDAALMALADYGAAVIRKPAEREALATGLAAIVSQEGVSDAARLFAAKQLLEVCPALTAPGKAASLLADPELSETVRYALERNEDPVVGRVLMRALRSADDSMVRVGLIHALGHRREARAAAALSRLLSDADPAVAEAAARALGWIGTPRAADALLRARGAEGVAAPARVIDDALLRAAQALAASGDGSQRETALAIFTDLADPEESPVTRAGALGGLVEVEGVSVLIAALEDEDALVRQAAAALLRDTEGADATMTLVDALPGLPASQRALVIKALADRGDPAAKAAVEIQVEDADGAVRLAALEALAVLGDAETVSILARKAAGADAKEAQAARRALGRLAGPGVDETIAAGLQDPRPEIRAALVAALAERLAADQADAVLGLTRDPEPAVRIAAFGSIERIGSGAHAEAVAQALVDEADEGARDAAASALVELARKTEAPAACVLAAFDQTADNTAARAALLGVLGELSDDAGLDVVRQAAAAEDATIREAGIRALAAWSNPAPAPDLFRVAKEGRDALRIVALRAYFRLLAMPDDRPAAETVEMYDLGLQLTDQADLKKMAIAGLADVPHPDAEAVIARYADDPELEADVAAALEKARSRAFAVRASHNTEQAGLAVDGEMGTRWTTGVGQTPGQWFVVDLGWERTVHGIVLDATGSDGDYPRGYRVHVGNSLEDLGEPAAEGEGSGARIELTFDPPQRGRFIRIEQTGSIDSLWWSIHELTLQIAD